MIDTSSAVDDQPAGEYGGGADVGVRRAGDPGSEPVALRSCVRMENRLARRSDRGWRGGSLTRAAGAVVPGASISSVPRCVGSMISVMLTPELLSTGLGGSGALRRGDVGVVGGRVPSPDSMGFAVMAMFPSALWTTVTDPAERTISMLLILIVACLAMAFWGVWFRASLLTVTQREKGSGVG